MSQFVLDEQLDLQVVLPPLKRWTTVATLREMRPDELIPDERVPEILLRLSTPTFVTIDQGFWDRKLCHPGYCVICFALRDDEQESLPPLLRTLVRHADFCTRKRRMGKVVHVGRARVDYFEHLATHPKQFDWQYRRLKPPKR